jgi:hypothetical protein
MNNEEVKSTERSNLDLSLRNTFQRYFQNWKEETLNTSASDDMFNNPNYQAIIKLGWNVVPYIIEQLREKPAHLFMALRAITGATPVAPGHVGRLYDMANDWINWYEKVYIKR